MNKRRRLQVILITVAIVAFISVLIVSRSNNRAKELKSNHFTTIAVVEKIEEDVMQGKSTDKDYIYFYFVKNDTVFHDVVKLNWKGTENFGISINTCFQVQVANSDYSNFKIDFLKRKDKKIDKDDFALHVYN